jgi:thiol-disulfide isomerase/thioredoxin
MIRLLRISIIIAFILLFALVLYYGGLFEDAYLSPTDGKTEWQPEKIPAITLKDLQGKQILIDDFNDRVVILNFWASWCEPCIKEFPSMLKLIKEYQGKVILIAVSNDDSIMDVIGFLKKFKKNFKTELASPYLYIAWDDEQRIASQWFNIIKFPESIIIDKKQNMVKKIAGGIDWLNPQIKSFLDSLL